MAHLHLGSLGGTQRNKEFPLMESIGTQQLDLDPAKHGFESRRFQWMIIFLHF